MPSKKMGQSARVAPLVMLAALTLHWSSGQTTSPKWGTAQVMYEWVTVDFEWPNDTIKLNYIQKGMYEPTHNLISGIKTYKGRVYVTVPRLKYTTGVPSTLNILVSAPGNKTVLRPFPDWSAQELGNCSALQCAMSMEVDPITGYMYVIDPGRSGIFGNITGQPPPTICPPKLVVYNLNDGSLVRSHNFPSELVNNDNFLNDIVLDRGYRDSTSARWVYITDAVVPKLIIFNLDTNQTHTVYDHTMDFDQQGNGTNITVNGMSYILRTPIDGLAMSSDFRYVYYCALGSRDLYQVPAEVLRDPTENFTGQARFVGAKKSQTGGMTYATNSLFYGALTENAVYRWDVAADTQGKDVSQVFIKTEEMVVQDSEKLQWPDSFTVDEEGYLWFTACRAQFFLLGGMNFTGGMGSNFRIWRVPIYENGYLAPPVAPTASATPYQNPGTTPYNNPGNTPALTTAAVFHAVLSMLCFIVYWKLW